MMRFLKEKEKEKEKDKDKDKDKDQAKEHKEQAKKERREEKEREKLEKRKEKEKDKENGKAVKEVDMGTVDWKGAKSSLKNRRSNSFSVQEQRKPISPPSRLRNTFGRNSVSLMDLHEGALKNKQEGKVPLDGRTNKQKQKEKAFLESIAQHSHEKEKPSAFAIASESYKLRIIELEEEVVHANKRVTSLTDRVHMLEAEIRAAHEHHTRQNATLQEKLANVETANAVLKNSFEGKKQKNRELKAKLELADFALQQSQEEAEEGKDGEQKGATKSASNGSVDGEKAKEVKLPSSTSSRKFTSLTPAIIKSLGLVQNLDKSVESAMNQRVQILEAELSTKTNDLAVLKLLTSNLEPQVKTLTQDLAKAKQDAIDNGEQVGDVIEMLGEWQTAMEVHDVELRELLADESEVPTDEEIRRLNKKVLLLRERISVVDQIIDRIAKTVGVNSVRFELGVTTSAKAKTPSKDHKTQSLALNPSHAGIRSNTLNERDAALTLKLAVLTMGTEPAVQKLMKGIRLNTVRSVNLGGGLTLSIDIIQDLSKALLVSTTVLSVLFPNTFLGDAGVVLLADAMRENSSITNLNLEECGVADAGVAALAQALAANKKGALVTLNLSHNNIGEHGSQSLATYIEGTQTLTHLDLGYSHLGSASAPFISQALQKAYITHLFLPGNDFRDEGASKLATALHSNTHLQVFNFQGNGITEKGATQIAEALPHCHIHTLDLSRNPIGPQGAEALADAIKFTEIHLKELSLISSSIHTRGASCLADALEHNSTLTTLHLWGNKIGLEGLAAFSAENRLGKLKNLDLRGNELPPASGQELATMLAKKSPVSFLDLTGNHLGPKGCELLSKSLVSATLTSLSLSANSMGNEGVMHIARALGPALTTLSLSLNFLGDDAMDHLAPRLLSPSNITHLDLSWNHIGSGGARELSKVLEQHKCPITTLNLEGNSLGPDGTVLIAAALHSNTTLTHLILAANNFRKDGAKAIADLLKRSPTISTINISKNGIKDEGALALADALKTNVSLITLDLSENRIENSGILSLSEALKLNSSLLSINLSHNPFDRSAVQSLSQAHARNLKVHVILHSM